MALREVIFLIIGAEVNRKIEDWIESLRKAESRDFDVLVPDHGALGRKAGVRLTRNYMEELGGEVLQYMRQVKSAEEIEQVVKMEKCDSGTTTNNICV